MKDQLTTISRFLSMLLRHHPETIGLKLDSGGWADVEELLTKSRKHGKHLTRTLLDQVVSENDKKRFAFNDARTQIRASQGHTIKVELGIPPSVPPEILFHGTPRQFVNSIRKAGLLKGKRQHVHLSIDTATATKVGERRGKPVILTVKSGEMFRAGILFYLSENGVWLTDHVPPQYLQFPNP